MSADHTRIRANVNHDRLTALQYWCAAGLLLALFWVMHPDLLTLGESAMLGDLWALKDPSVSWSAYMPGLREFRYELIENGNILWSPHRGLGQPIFGNGVQGAPLFPLTLLQLWIPDQLFWTINPVSRIFVCAVMLFLCARNLFKLPWLPSLIFALLAAYNLNMFRWINHPWTNGALAGIWYLYFLVQVSLPNNFSAKRRCLHIIGLVLGVVGMVTNGFPEASAVFAFVVAFVYPAILIARWDELSATFSQTTARLLLIHLIGFGLSAVQIIGLLEYIDYTQVMGLRDGISSNALQPQDIEQYLNSQLSIFWKTELQRDYISFTVGVIGGFLALQGLLALILDRKRFGRITTSVGVGFLLCMAMFVTKSFGLSDAVEWVFSKTPVLDVSHFPLYFPPMFYFGSAFFAALGLMAYGYQASETRTYHVAKLMWVIVSFTVMLLAIRSVAIYFSAVGIKAFWLQQFSAQGFSFLWLFLLLTACLVVYHLVHLVSTGGLKKWLSGSSVALALGGIAAIGITLEQRHTVEANFVSIDNHRLFRTDEELAAVEKAVQASGLAKHELRTRDESGEYIQAGLATIDNGASAMLPADMRLIRRALYDAPYGGYIPLRKAYYDWSGWLLSNNVTAVHATPFSNKDWSSYQASDSILPQHVRDDSNIEILRENPALFADWVVGFSKPESTDVWAKFSDGVNERWLLTNNGGKRVKVVGNATQTSNLWRIRLPIHELPENKYQITLRVVDKTQNVYQDAAPIRLSIGQRENAAGESVIKQPKDRLLVQYDNGTRSMYLEHNALPRAFIASSCEHHNDPNDTLEMLKQGLPVLAGKIAINSDSDAFCADYRAEFARTPILSDGGSKLSFSKITGPALLFVNDSYYPGWQARDALSSDTFQVHRANVAMRAVLLPKAKDYQIEMFYQPTWLYLVQVITGLAVLLFIALIWNTLRERRTW